MATQELVFQGFTPHTHQQALRWVLECPQLQSVALGVAFANQAGVDLVAPELQAIAGKLTAYVGVRNGVTTKQALQRLLSLGAQLYAVDTGSRTLTYHPKLYFARGAAEARILLGSANLTLGGMNNNIEVSAKVTLDLAVAAERALATQVEDTFVGLPTAYAQNVVRVQTADEVLELLRLGRVLDEAVALAPHPATKAATPQQDVVPTIALKVPRQFSKVPKIKPAPPAPVTASAPVIAGVSWVPVWKSKALAERDLSIPQGANTNATGSINLDKGLLAEAVDHRHYFREEVFQHLAWTPSKATVDISTASFQLVVKAVAYGTFSLTVAHTTSTDTPAYKQHNAMTRLRWGAMKAHIAHANLLGRNLTLFRDSGDPTKFLIEID